MNLAGSLDLFDIERAKLCSQPIAIFSILMRSKQRGNAYFSREVMVLKFRNSICDLAIERT